MTLKLQYGLEGLAVELDDLNITVVEPVFVPGLPDEAGAFISAVRKPAGSRPLRELVRADETVAVVIPDITRPLPTGRILTWLFQEIAHVPAQNITIVNGTGSHRANTGSELDGMLGAGIAAKYRVVNHNAHDPSTMNAAGSSPSGRPVFMNREYVQADRRIVVGLVEPHFFAGFSGGYKAVMPGIADIASIMEYHSAPFIGHPKSTWGLLDGNPTQEHIRACGALLPVDFCINPTINRNREITSFFCGSVAEAHALACKFARSTVMVECKRRFPVVITTNGGYPLDQNLYQAVKGMSAAAQIVEDGGLIICAARCNDGFPEHGNFKKLLHEHQSPEAILKTVQTPGFSVFDQWEAQKLALIQIHARVALYSEIPADDVRRAHLEPVNDIAARVAQELKRIGQEAAIAVLPEGPMTIPYVSAR